MSLEAGTDVLVEGDMQAVTFHRFLSTLTWCTTMEGMYEF
jgi:acylphosphatase